MGYDVHIVRTENWLDAASNPIRKQDVEELLASSNDLVWSESDYIETVNSSGEHARSYAIVWQDSPIFYWLENEIICSNPNEKQIMKMVEMAAKLGANAIGDDEETYRIKKGLLGKKKLVIEHG